VRNRDPGLGRRLKIEDIEGVGRGADDRRLLQRLVGQRQGVRGSARGGRGQITEPAEVEPGGGENGTGGEELEELAAIGYG
jgi:hypothetical protein